MCRGSGSRAGKAAAAAAAAGGAQAVELCQPLWQPMKAINSSTPSASAQSAPQSHCNHLSARWQPHNISLHLAMAIAKLPLSDCPEEAVVRLFFLPGEVLWPIPCMPERCHTSVDGHSCCRPLRARRFRLFRPEQGLQTSASRTSRTAEHLSEPFWSLGQGAIPGCICGDKLSLRNCQL